jgi:membrane protease YdiL (CAAX protease family)
LATLAPSAPSDETQTRRTILWAELFVIMAFAFLPTYLAGFTTSTFQTTPGIELYSAFHSLERLALILFVVWIADGTLAGIGISKPNWKVDGLAVLALLALILLLFVLAYPVLPRPTAPVRPIRTDWQSIPIWLPLTAVIATTLMREVLARGYVLARLKELLGNQWVAIVLSALVFSLPHSVRLPSAGFNFLLFCGFGWSFFYTKRIWAGLFLSLIPAIYEVMNRYAAIHH